ncbi:hypothetical protein ACX1HO_19890 [Yersinia enterocolitica]|uniref:hypothetical protein n=1 Tax=Yersinia enterocolitica TaxID=630 RepID=UPI001C8D0A3C|nr:hypothetical protein [Yersinia enterocolitica]EKN3715718.1 hypothetical protein [Yersinia enterocolitica]EKN3734726.1 hypothetical protein [Yersinia enterocolitica]EKN3850450.1 hypothetical protein [Yersinia enterocolitica]EKN4829454.1 hypothetical protein [Yersinia enterocolitica]EKN4851442.1 hypothetical protein [Yersinia enterocolitica]
MFTVKIMSPKGGEEIHCGLSVGFNPEQQSISIAGLEANIILHPNDVAYVMNSNGKTVSQFHHMTCSQ